MKKMTVAQVTEKMNSELQVLYEALYEADELPGYMFNPSDYARVNNYLHCVAREY